MTIEPIDDADRFGEMRDGWNELLAASSAQSPFLTWEWLHAWWTHLREERSLAILAVSDGAQLVGLAPFARSCDRWRMFPHWEFLGTGFAGSDYLDAIVRPGRDAEVATEIATFVRSEGISMRLRHLPSSAVLSRLTFSLRAHGWRTHSTADGVCPFIVLRGHTWDSFLATIGPAHRATTRRRLRALRTKFAMRFEPIADAAAVESALGDLFAFHEARFGSRGTAFHTPSLQAFHRDVCRRLQEAGYLRMFALYVNDRPVAVMYWLAFKNRFLFYQHGYDPHFQSLGVGRALLDMTIRAAIEEGLAEFDLLYGIESYKSAWTSANRPLVRIDCFPDHLGGRLHRQTVDTERTLRALARRVISAHVAQTS